MGIDVAVDVARVIRIVVVVEVVVVVDVVAVTMREQAYAITREKQLKKVIS